MQAANENVAGVILSGGGAYAAYEVGVMLALFKGQSPSTEYRPLVPQVLAGTSAGAFNAAMIASLPELDLESAAQRLADVWLDQIADLDDECGNGLFRFRVNPLEAFGIGCPRSTPAQEAMRLKDDVTFLGANMLRRVTQFFGSDVGLQQRFLELADVSTVISTDPFADVMRRNIKLDGVRRSTVQLRVSATNWRTGDLRTFRTEELTDEHGYEILRASAAVPGLFDSVDVDGEPYVDGGLVMNTPLKEAIGAGADTLHIVYINPKVVAIPLPRVRSTMNSMFRTLVIGLAATAGSDIEKARQVNIGIKLLQAAETLAVPARLKAIIQQLAGVARRLGDDSPPYRMLTIHRYSPREMVGGLYQWLGFDRDHVVALIQRGYADAISHDCDANGCVLRDEVANA